MAFFFSISSNDFFPKLVVFLGKSIIPLVLCCPKFVEKHPQGNIHGRDDLEGVKTILSMFLLVGWRFVANLRVFNSP